MDLEQLKKTIEQRAGIPATLLTGETAEENIAQAKALLAYKREYDQQHPKTAKEQFGAWIGGELEKSARNMAAVFGLEYTPPADPAGEALTQIEEAARVEAGGYPRVNDGGSVNVGVNDGRSTQEQFAEWFMEKTAFNPRKQDAWEPLSR